ncbi:MAG: transketolase [Clostridiales bacterium]|nr:transketolase [Clostridiales bacterium]
MDNKIAQLEDMARQIRFGVVDTIYRAKDGHPGPALGVVDIIAALYFSEMNVDPKRPKDPDRDRFILSKGHACPAHYVALSKRGYFDEAELPTLRFLNSNLQGHPCVQTAGVDMTTGSLGNGISIGLGMEIARRLQGKSFYTYVVTGDGELNEGVCWEGIMAAKHNGAENLIVFVDNNGHQSGGHISEISGIEPLADKFRDFGWDTREIDGNDIAAILDAIHRAKNVRGVPHAIIARTVKGKGVSYMENNNAWHKGTPTEEQWRRAAEELGGVAK